MRGRPAAPDGFPVPAGIEFHTLDLKTGAVDGGGVRAAFRESDVLSTTGIGTAVKLKLPVDTATGLRATADTPPDRVEIIEVDPADVAKYLGGAG